MPLFGKNKEKVDHNSIQINNLNDLCRQNYIGWMWHEKHIKPFHKLILFTIWDQIFRGLQNVSYLNQKNHNFSVDTIISFIESNYIILLDQYWSLGYMAIQCNKYLHMKIIPVKEIRVDGNGRVINKNSIVVYSPHYQTDRLSDVKIVKPWLEMFDGLGSAESEGIENMGVLPIISGDSIPANPEFKKDLSEMMKKEFGSSNKYPYFLSKTKLDVQTINLNMKDLEINVNMLDCFKYLCRYFGVPTDFIIGESTFTNSEQAVQHFYNTTIRFYAELFLQLGQAIITSYTTDLPKNSLNYKIMNVPGMDKSLSDAVDEKKKVLELLVSLKAQGVDVESDILKIHEDLKMLYKEA